MSLPVGTDWTASEDFLRRILDRKEEAGGDRGGAREEEGEVG